VDIVKARVQTDKKLYIHNDLSQGATYFSDNIQDKLKNGSRDAIAFDGMACALMVAFAFEANLNFMGNYLLKVGKISSWDERSKYSKKLQKVFDALGTKVEPWRSRDLTHLCSPELTHQDGFPPYSINAVQCVCALSALQFVLT
jgi:hypothetical protein